MKPALAQVCSLESPFAVDMADYSAAQCRAIEVWLGKLDRYLETHSVGDVRALVEEHGVSIPVASFQGGLLTSQGARREEQWTRFGDRLELCRDLQIGTLVVAADVLEPLQPQDLDRLRVSLDQAAERASRYEVRLALEFQAPAAFCNNLQTAVALVEETGSRWLGICLDAFHFEVGCSKVADLTALTSDNLFHVQLSDLAGPPRELARDADRILPGDGDFDLTPIVQRLREISYTGYVSVELMNPQIWKIPALSFGEISMTALRTLLGLTEPE